jgi:hypothetical protein
MSPPDLPPNEPKVWPPERNRGPIRQGPIGGGATAFLVLVGIVLLLPGACSLIVMANSGFVGGAFGGLMLVTFVIAAAGIALISYAVRHL